MTGKSRTHSNDLVSVADRVLYMRVFRLVATVLVVLAMAAEAGWRESSATQALVVTGAYLAIVLFGDLVWRLSGRRALWLVGGLLIIDGVYLAWISYVAAPENSVLRYLVVLHIVTVSLLASFRTGLKIAMWDSLLLLAAFHAQEAGALTSAQGPVSVGDGEYRSLVGSVIVFWVTAIATCSFAAVNERELRRRRYDLEALGALDRKLEVEADADGMASELVAAVVDDFGFDRVLLLTAPDGELTLSHAHGTDPAGSVVLAAHEGVLGRAAAAREPLLLASVPPDEEPVLAELLPGARNLAFIPLQAGGTVVGLLVCEHRMRRGSRIERRVVSMLERYASQAALALTGAWRLSRLERSASTDGLTGVANRHVFDDALTREIARAARIGGSVTLAMLDLDHFKSVNDTYGHVIGDEVLCDVAACVADRIRASDLVARFGGEEFAVVLPDLDVEERLAVLERIADDVRTLRPDLGVTISVGVATYPMDASDALTLVERADAALYASKHAGRDRCTTASELAA